MISGLKLLAGAGMLFFGRRLYWFSIAIVGFFTALDLGSRLIRDQSVWLAIVLALLVGGIGAVLAVTIQRLAVGIAGFLLGGFLLLQILNAFDLPVTIWSWLAFFVGGVLGMALLSALFEWALIVLSAIIGAILVTQSSILPEANRLLIFGIALLFGLCVQIYMHLLEKRRTPI